jgi:signal transduction histidine kinase
MKKVALVFVLAVLAPSLVLAWLAVRSLRDQQFLVERQQSLLDQRVTDTLAQNISDYLAQRQQEFSAQVESLAAADGPQKLAAQFDEQLRQHWPLAEVGFCVTAAGKILSPAPNARPAAQMFRLDNSGFLGNREPVEVYLTANNANAASYAGNGNANSSWNFGRSQANGAQLALNGYSANSAVSAGQPARAQAEPAEAPGVNNSSAPSPPIVAGLGGGGENASSRNSPTLAVAANGAPSQAFALADNLGKDSSSTMKNQPLTGRNGFYIGSASLTLATQDQLKSSGLSNQALATEGFAESGSGKFVRDANAFDSRQPPPLDGVSNPAFAVYSAIVRPQQPEAAAAAMAKLTPSADVQVPQIVAKNEIVAGQVASSTSDQNPINYNYKAAQSRKVSPQSKKYLAVEKSANDGADDSQDNLSKVVPAEAEFRQLIGDQTDGMLARFLQNKLKLMCWHRLSAEPDLIFGAQLDLNRVVDGLRGLVQPDRSWAGDICLAVLDDNARPVVLSSDGFQTNWKRPFVATEVGDALPHWEVAAYLVNPAQLSQAAQTAKLTLGLLIAVLVTAIGVGSLLIVRALEAELKLARQKTDFVSNVSHELKTPLTSIRMFSELLAEGRVADAAKQKSYLQIITAETARLTRLINSVLDFSRLERGEKKYNFQACDLTGIVRATAETYRPQLEAAGFQFTCELPAAPIHVRGDADALSQIIVNLLSNAEKYSNGGKEIALQLAQQTSPLPHAEIKVLDRGAGVPRGSEQKIFEKFYRAHDSLSEGVQGSGLGLTIARQIARAHGGDVTYEPRQGGGSCFVLRLPVSTS